MKKICLFIVLTTSILLVSCKKSEIGPAGVNGKDGSSSLIIEYVTIEPADWKHDDLYNQWYYRYKPTMSTTDSSMVITSLLTNNGYQTLPYLDKVTTNYFNFSENLASTNPYLEFQYSNSTMPVLRPIDQLRFKVSILPKK